MKTQAGLRVGDTHLGLSTVMQYKELNRYIVMGTHTVTETYVGDTIKR